LNRRSNTNTNDDITAQLQEAAAEEEATGTGTATGIGPTIVETTFVGPPSESSSSWSSKVDAIPYNDAQVDGISGGGAATTATATPSTQSQHWIPSPQMLALQQQQQQQQQRNEQQQHGHTYHPSVPPPSPPPSSSSTSNNNCGASTDGITSSQRRFERFREFFTELYSTNKDENNNTKSIKEEEEESSYVNAETTTTETQHTTRVQQFTAELKELVFDLIEYSKAKTWKKKLLTVSLCLSSVLVFCDLIFGHYIVDFLRLFMMWMTTHSIEAVFAFVAIFVVSTCTYGKSNISMLMCCVFLTVNLTISQSYYFSGGACCHYVLSS
jgi:hypothetical protein